MLVTLTNERAVAYAEGNSIEEFVLRYLDVEEYVRSRADQSVDTKRIVDAVAEVSVQLARQRDDSMVRMRELLEAQREASARDIDKVFAAVVAARGDEKVVADVRVQLMAHQAEQLAEFRKIADKVADTQSKISAVVGSSSIKGRVAESLLFDRLSRMFSDCEVERKAKETACGDFWLRKGVRGIVVENKSHTANVRRRDIEKFERDVAACKMHGILVSERSGVAGKAEFEIDIRDGNVLVYLGNCTSDDVIQFAVETICKIEAVYLADGADHVDDIVVDPQFYVDIRREHESNAAIRKMVVDQLKAAQRGVESMRSVHIGRLVDRYVHSAAANTVDLLTAAKSVPAAASPSSSSASASTATDPATPSKTQTFPCDVCARKFVTQSGMRRHATVMHQTKAKVQTKDQTQTQKTPAKVPAKSTLPTPFSAPEELVPSPKSSVKETDDTNGVA